MKQIIFEVTETKTEIVIDGERTDITNTEVEKRLVKLLEELQGHKMAAQILDAIDINKWETIYPNTSNK